MKTYLAILVVLFFSIASLQAQAPPPPAEGKAVVYFMRLGVFGAAVTFAHFDGDRFIGKFGGSSYLRHECDPGEHLFWARSENRDFLPAELEAGKTYFVQVFPAQGMAKAKVLLVPIDPNEIKRIARFERKIRRKPGLQPTQEDLAQGNLDREDGIEKGLAQYREFVTEGKEFKRLEADMYLGNYHH